MTSIWTEALSKAAQNKTPSAGLGRATIDWCFLIFQSRVQFPSCREQTGKPQPKAQLKAELNTNWRVIEAIATSKEVAGTINGSSCWLWLQNVNQGIARWILEENNQAVLQAVDVQLICIARHLVGFLLLDCLAHWKQTQKLNWFSQSTKFER